MRMLSPMQGSDVTTSKDSVTRVISTVAGSAAVGAYRTGTAATMAATRAARTNVVIVRTWTFRTAAGGSGPATRVGVPMMDVDLHATVLQPATAVNGSCRRRIIRSGWCWDGSDDAEFVAFGVGHDDVVEFAVLLVKAFDRGAGGDESVDDILDLASA